MPSPNAKKNRAKPPGRRSADWSPAARTIATLLLLWHLVAVVAAPWAGPPPSELAQKVIPVFRPYLGAMYLDHGYRFFGPDPPQGSNLVSYKLTMPAGSEQAVIKGTFPDRRLHKPRMAYHRHFMITSQVIEWAVPPEDDIVPADPPPAFFAEAPAEDVKQYHGARKDYEQRLDQTAPAMQSIAEHLLHTHGAESVELTLELHRVPARQSVIEGMQLTDKSLYRQRYLGRLDSGGAWQWSEEIFGKRKRD